VDRQKSGQGQNAIESGAIVIGAGPGGLGVAGCLTRTGIDVTVLEQGDDVATRWRNGYDDLRLNTSSLFSYLPGQRFPRQAGRWVGRDELVDYYRHYAARHDLRIHTGVRAERIEQTLDGWEILTSQGSYRAPIAVVATGKHHEPVIPAWPGLTDFQGETIHSASYRNARPFCGKRVLIVGIGNSGTDISVDVVRGGAAKVWLSARRPPHIIPRDLLGIPHDVFGVASRHLPRRVADKSARLLRRVKIGDLGEIGLPVPEDGATTRFEEEGRVPTIDSGNFVQAVYRKHVSVVPAVERFEGDTVLLRDGTSVNPDAVIAATGYSSNLDHLVGHIGILDSEGLPIVHGGNDHISAPNLYFVGFADPRSGHLRELRLQAKQVAHKTRSLME
jgi:putative flavoprotein involved in K+ transport